MANKMRYGKTSINILKLISLIFILSNFELSHFKTNHFINSANASSQSDVDNLFERGRKLYKSGRHEEAIKIWLQALKIYQNSNPLRESEILSKISLAYTRLHDAPEALSYAKQAVQRSKGIHPDAQSLALYVLGVSYGNYELYPDAVNSYEKALEITQITNDPQTRADTLIGLGDAYGSWGKYDRAIKAYEDANKLAMENNYPRIKQHVKEHLNYLYMMVANPGHRELKFDQSFNKCDILGEIRRSNYQRKSDCFKNIGAKGQELYILTEAGKMCSSLEDYVCAFEALSQALVISQEIGVTEREADVLKQISILLYRQKQIELTIVFLKKSVSIYEIVRSESKSLPPELKNIYIQSVSPTYRILADILLSQDRVLEAQQILDLLKVQELDDYFQNVRGTAQAIEFRRAEQEILIKYNEIQKSAIQIGLELASLRKLDSKDNLDPTQKQRLTKLVNLETDINKQFIAFIDSPEIKVLTTKLQQNSSNEALSLPELRKLRDKLDRLDAVLLYPLILDDRLELVLSVPGSPPLRRPVPVKREELNRTIAEFRSVLGNRQSNTQELAEKLYGWLIKPIEADLTQANRKTILYSPDGQLRYIPLAALHDGKQWLIERYRVNNITALAVSDLVTPPRKDQQILAAAFGNNSVNVTVDNQSFSFAGLPFATKEVQSLAQTRPGTVSLFDRDFSLSTLRTRMNSFNILHLATHGKFLIGNPKKSFLVMGNGDRFSLSDIQDSTLDNVDLVVLSACETGVGLTGKDEDGIEVLGIGYQFQRGGAKAAISSLWSINDGGTQKFMEVFYGLLQQGMPKAEALQQAQVALIKNDLTANGKLRGSFQFEPIGGKASIETNLKHPFYWAPFILIGNGL